MDNSKKFLEERPELQLYTARKFWGQLRVDKDFSQTRTQIEISVVKPMVNRFVTVVGPLIPLALAVSIIAVVAVAVSGFFENGSERTGRFMLAGVLTLAIGLFVAQMIVKLGDDEASTGVKVWAFMDSYETTPLAVSIRECVAELDKNYSIDAHRRLYKLVAEQQKVSSQRNHERFLAEKAKRDAKDRSAWV